MVNYCADNGSNKIDARAQVEQFLIKFQIESFLLLSVWRHWEWAGSREILTWNCMLTIWPKISMIKIVAATAGALLYTHTNKIVKLLPISRPWTIISVTESTVIEHTSHSGDWEHLISDLNRVRASNDSQSDRLMRELCQSQQRYDLEQHIIHLDHKKKISERGGTASLDQ